MGTPETTPSRLLTADEIRLRDRVPQEADFILGTARILELEQACDTAMQFDELARRDNPYVLPEPSEPDLSCLTPKQLQQLKAWGILKANWTQILNEIEQAKPNRLPRTHDKLEESGRALWMYVNSTTDDAKQIINSQAEAVKKLEEERHSRLQADHQDRLGIDVYAACVNDLEEPAKQLPTTATIKIIGKIYRTANAMAEAITNQPTPFVFSRIQNKLYGKRADRDGQNAKKSHILVEFKDRVRRLGYLNYEQLRELVQSEETYCACVVLDTAIAAKQLIEDRPDLLQGDHAGAMLVTEQYLKEKASFAEAILKEVSPELLRRDVVREVTQQLGTATLAGIIRNQKAEAHAKQQQARFERAKPFNAQVKEARDILKGGRRLKNGAPPEELAAKADGLHKLRSVGVSEQAKLLQPEECGVIMAILTDRFPALLGTIQRVHEAGNSDEVVNTITERHQAIVKQLREFDPTQTIARLDAILRHRKRRAQLETVLTVEEIVTIEAAILDFQKQRDSKAS